ncbi:aminotransferase class I/II-fold pyridoxal phosphate-dependent enzyme, partial [Agathobacter rectalis]
TDFKITPEAIRSHVNDKTKAILLNYPTNPTGVILNRTEAEAIAEELQQHEIFVLSDEIYAENTFKGKHTSLAEFEGLRDQLLLISGLSKS